MAQRKFELPAIEDLSKDQEVARALPLQGQHLVIGGPGTGKSVMALLRARRHSENGDDYLFLVYNRLLHQSSCQLFTTPGGANVPVTKTKLRIETWDKWFRNIIMQLAHIRCPVLPPKKPGGYQDIDWVGVEKLIQDQPVLDQTTKRPFLIIDEGQDMPPHFYAALEELGYENFFVVADQNQQIVPGINSSREDIENALGIHHTDVLELRENYRNSFPVARLARHFYPPNPASPPPDLPPIKRSARTPILVDYGEDGRLGFQKLVERVLIMADRDPRKLIGIFTPLDTIRTSYVEALSAASVQLDNPRPKIQTYGSSNTAQGANLSIAFDEGGIMVINASSCKGLEFDSVFIADIHKFPCFPRIREEKRRLFYVMTARAKETVIFLKEANSHCEVESILPPDPQILKRWS